MSNKISILMSVYKPSKNGLIRTVNSVLNQTFKDFEFIIIIDDNTQSTIELIDEILSLDNRIKIIKNHKNIGLVKSLNKGLKNSCGEFIARIDVDDWWALDKLTLQYQYITTNNLDLLGTLVNFVDLELAEIDFNNSIDVEQQIINGKNPFVHSSVMFRRKKDIFYNENALYVEDFELWCRYYIFGKISCLDKKLTYYVISDSGITGTKRYIMFRNSIIVYTNFVKQLIARDKESKKLIERHISNMYKYAVFVNTHVINKAIKYKTERNKFKEYFYSLLSCILEPSLLYYLGIRKYYSYILKKEIKK